jgi:hypothetical protein
MMLLAQQIFTHEGEAELMFLEFYRGSIESSLQTRADQRAGIAADSQQKLTSSENLI